MNGDGFKTALQNLIEIHGYGWPVYREDAEVQVLGHPYVDADALWQAFEDWRISNGLPTHEPTPTPLSEMREILLLARGHSRH